MGASKLGFNVAKVSNKFLKVCLNKLWKCVSINFLHANIFNSVINWEMASLEGCKKQQKNQLCLSSWDILLTIKSITYLQTCSGMKPSSEQKWQQSESLWHKGLVRSQTGDTKAHRLCFFILYFVDFIKSWKPVKVSGNWKFAVDLQ